MAGEFKHKEAGGLLESSEYHDTTCHEASGQASGDILYFNGTNWQRLAKGTDGDVLTSGATPAWATRNAIPSIVLGSAAAAGAAATSIQSDATIAAFDATSPSTQALGDSAVVGSAAYAARRDHKHALMSGAAASDLNTGTDTTKPVTSDAFAGSNFGKRVMYIKVIAETTALATGDGKAIITIPSELTGMNLVDADAAVYTVSSSGLPNITIYNLTDSQDMLSTAITIDATEYTSYTAVTAPIVNTSYDDVVTGDRIEVNVDGAGTGTAGLDIILTFQLP